MNLALLIGRRRAACLTLLMGVAHNFMAPYVIAEEILSKQYEKTLGIEQRAQVNYDAYILGPGDGLQIELLDLPELSGTFTIGRDGTLYLPRLRALYVEGLTVEELRYLLSQQFSKFVRDLQLYVRPVVYRPIRIFVGGEVVRPGYYTLSGDTDLTRLSESAENRLLRAGTATDVSRPSLIQPPGGTDGGTASNGLSTFGAVFPTVFDAIRSAQGITPFSNLSKVQVTRKRAQGLGGGRIRTNLNFLTLLTEGNDSQNIRLFDGDVVSVGRSNVILREQLIKAGQSNLNPQFINVFVSGRVKIPGGVTIPQGSVLNQAIALAGGTKLLRGKVEFLRFTREGRIDRRIFRYNPGASANAHNNPLLSPGDVIRVLDSPERLSHSDH